MAEFMLADHPESASNITSRKNNQCNMKYKILQNCLKDNLISIIYRHIFQPLALPSIQAIEHGGAVFQDDNAHPHRVRVVDDFLQH